MTGYLQGYYRVLTGVLTRLAGTDPSKYVYEELAIAAYLLCLWELEREAAGSDTMQTFADLGWV